MKKTTIATISVFAFIGLLACFVALSGVTYAEDTTKCQQGDETACYGEATSRAQAVYDDAEMEYIMAKATYEQALATYEEATSNLAWNKYKDLKDGGYPDATRLQELGVKAGIVF